MLKVCCEMTVIRHLCRPKNSNKETKDELDIDALLSENNWV